jgi:hypothetical protein
MTRRPLSEDWYRHSFWSRTRRDPATGCLLWTGASHGKSGAIYGFLRRQGRYIAAHRQAWIYAHGPIPEGVLVLHHCDTPLCVEPFEDGHLFLGSHGDNVHDMMAKGRQRFPPKGEAHHKAKLRLADLPEVRQLRAEGWSQQRIADRFGVTQTTIGRVLSGAIWK